MIIEKCKKKKKKGQVSFGSILIAFIAVIVGVIIFTIVAQNVGVATSTVAVANESLGDADNSTTVYLTAYRSISDVVIYNGSAIVPSTDYTVTNNVVYNGQEAVSVLPASAPDDNYTGYEWNISGTAEPVGYIGGSSRAIALLIPIFFALLVALLALEPTMRSGLKDLMGK